MDGKHHLAVLIKVLGKWTEKLREKIIHGEALKELSVVKVSVEGPYGHEVPYHLMYVPFSVYFSFALMVDNRTLGLVSNWIHREK